MNKQLDQIARKNDDSGYYNLISRRARLKALEQKVESLKRRDQKLKE